MQSNDLSINFGSALHNMHENLILGVRHVISFKCLIFRRNLPSDLIYMRKSIKMDMKFVHYKWSVRKRIVLVLAPTVTTVIILFSHLNCPTGIYNLPRHLNIHGYPKLSIDSFEYPECRTGCDLLNS